MTSFKLSILFGGSWGRTENWLEPKTKPSSENLACPNLWNALYEFKSSFFQFANLNRKEWMAKMMPVLASLNCLQSHIIFVMLCNKLTENDYLNTTVFLYCYEILVNVGIDILCTDCWLKLLRIRHSPDQRLYIIWYFWPLSSSCLAFLLQLSHNPWLHPFEESGVIYLCMIPK